MQLHTASTSHVCGNQHLTDACSEEEALADMNAFNREYDNDNSWEQLQEDEYGHLRPLVRKQAASCSIKVAFSSSLSTWPCTALHCNALHMTNECKEQCCAIGILF